MTAFSVRSFSGIETLGEKLRRLREEARLSLEEFAESSGIQPRFVQALEAGQYDRLPGEAYVRNFLRIYADQFHVNPDRVFELYRKESRVVRPVTPDVLTPPKALPQPHAIRWHRVFKRLLLGACVAGLLVYLGLKVRTILTPPQLTVTSPAADMTTQAPSILVEGVTEREATVTINGQQALADPSGHFAETVDMEPGLNIIKVAAKKERSRKTTISRQVVYTIEDGTGPLTTPDSAMQ